MSSGYTSQPATKGKVILKTSAGDLEIELWPKEAPKTCRNFVQLCMEGYYDDNPIHRIIGKFIVQTGDPTGTGLGGESIYGGPFADEFHSRLRFSQRGLLAMANTGQHQNQSQFFFTLDPTPALNGKNTIFGKIVGNTIFNLLSLGELETDKQDRPIFDAKIISTTILSNPFEDIEPRTTREERTRLKAAADKTRLELEKANRPKGQKNLALLSFGGDEAVVKVGKRTDFGSSHDLLGDVNGLSKANELEPVQAPAKKRKIEVDEEADAAFDLKMREKISKNKSTGKSEPAKISLQDQIKKLQGEIKQIGAPKKEIVAEVKKQKGTVAKMRLEFLATGKAISAVRKDGKGDVVAKLKGFEDALKQAALTSKLEGKSVDKKAVKPEDEWECSLHFIKNCSSCRDTFGQEVSEDDEDWMNATLKFEKAVGANVYEPKIDDYTVVDPRQGYACILMYRAKADPFGRDIQAVSDISSRQKRNWTEKSTRTVKAIDNQAAEAPEYQRQ